MRVAAEFPGKLPCKIALVGEAPGGEEALAGLPFVGMSGKLLDDLLRAAGIERNQCLVTNVFMDQPPQNKVGHFFMKRIEAKEKRFRSVYPPFGTHGFLRPEFEHELTRLYSELGQAQPTIIIALGATPLWALTGFDKISKYRGTTMRSKLGFKMLATYHPAYVMRAWDSRPLVVADLIKAAKHSEFKELRRTKRVIWVAETLKDIQLFEETHLKGAPRLSVDVETEPDARQITHFSVAPSATRALVVPIWDKLNPNIHFWSLDDEAWIMLWLRRVLENPSTEKLFQNGVYDMSYFDYYGFPTKGAIHDTMLMHHSLQPELEKGLDVLGSVYCDESAWKKLRVRAKVDINKKDD